LGLETSFNLDLSALKTFFPGIGFSGLAQTGRARRLLKNLALKFFQNPTKNGFCSLESSKKFDYLNKKPPKN
jgi:hypothetical protein